MTCEELSMTAEGDVENQLAGPKAVDLGKQVGATFSVSAVG